MAIPLIPILWWLGGAAVAGAAGYGVYKAYSGEEGADEEESKQKGKRKSKHGGKKERSQKGKQKVRQKRKLSPDTIIKITISAEQGFVEAQLYLAALYCEGVSVTQDYVEAGKWFRRASEGGNAIARYTLGVMYAMGVGVVKDPAEAVDYWLRAAYQGFTPAQHALALAYAVGNGVAQDDVVAYRWLLLAEEGLDNPPATPREQLEARMSAAQIREARRLAEQAGWRGAPRGDGTGPGDDDTGPGGDDTRPGGDGHGPGRENVILDADTGEVVGAVKKGMIVAARAAVENPALVAKANSGIMTAVKWLAGAGKKAVGLAAANPIAALAVAIMAGTAAAALHYLHRQNRAARGGTDAAASDEEAALYRFFDEAGNPAYYGTSNDPERRQAQHRNAGKPFVDDSHGMEVIARFADRDAASEAEKAVMREVGRLRELHNKQHNPNRKG